jgi:hypothetical protein
MRQGEDKMKISTGQEFGFPVVEPFFFDQGLTFGTMPVPAGIIRNAFKTAMAALLHMPAKFRGTTGFNMPHHLKLGRW